MRKIYVTQNVNNGGIQEQKRRHTGNNRMAGVLTTHCTKYKCIKLSNYKVDGGEPRVDESNQFAQ